MVLLAASSGGAEAVALVVFFVILFVVVRKAVEAARPAPAAPAYLDAKAGRSGAQVFRGLLGSRGREPRRGRSVSPARVVAGGHPQ